MLTTYKNKYGATSYKIGNGIVVETETEVIFAGDDFVSTNTQLNPKASGVPLVSKPRKCVIGFATANIFDRSTGKFLNARFVNAMRVLPLLKQVH